MIKDKYTALWVSHSSMTDYLKCPRFYYLRNVYRDPKTNRKITLMSPSLALGQAVHESMESLSKLPLEQRDMITLLDAFEKAWEKISGEKGGFHDATQEEEMKNKGKAMVERVANNPGPILKKAVKLRQPLPYIWLSEDDNIILCGKIDWLEYLPDTDSLHIIDFKTGKFDEDPESLQLPIYYLLVKNIQPRPVTKASYWYLDRDDEPYELPLPDEEASKTSIMEIAKRIELARKLNRFVCPKPDGCMFCRPYETILRGEAKYVGVGEYSQDIYTL